MELRVMAPEPGSLLVSLALVAIAGAGSAGLFPKDLWQLSTTLVTQLNALFSLRKHLKKESPKQVQEKQGDVVVESFQGSTIIVDKRTFNTYMSNTTINSQLDRTFRALDADPEVSAFEIRDAHGQATFSAERNEFPEMTTGALGSGENKRTITQRTSLSIVKVSFDPKLRWEFTYLGGRIGAHVSDKEFCSRVDSGESFSKGDVLDVDLEIDQVWDARSLAFQDRGYKVIKVYGHPKVGTQQSFSPKSPGDS